MQRVLAQPNNEAHVVSTDLPQALQSSLSLVGSITSVGVRHLWWWKADRVMTHLHWRHIVNRSKNSASGKPGWLNESSLMSFKNGDSTAMGARVWIFDAPV
jgi:hypothetical protein